LEKYINILLESQNESGQTTTRVIVATELKEGQRASNAPILVEEPRDDK